MYYYKNGIRYEAPDPTLEEIAAMQAVQAETEAEYWRTVDYDTAVSALIRERYSLDAELAINRQRDTKPDEFATHFSFCEECKQIVKQKKGIE